MVEAKLTKELFIETVNKVGMLEELTSKIAAKGVNIEAVNAYVVGDKAYFRLIVTDIAKAKSALAGFKAEEKEVVIVNLKNKVGAAGEIASKLKKANINLTHVYGSICACRKNECNSLFIFSSNNNQKAIEVLS